MRKHLSMPSMIEALRDIFSEIPEPVTPRLFSLVNCLMMGLAVFTLKFKSLLQFELDARAGKRKAVPLNLGSLLGIEGRVLSDSGLGVRLDRIDCEYLRPAFREIWRRLQRGGVLSVFQVLDGHYLIALDGTGYYASNCIKCDRCLTKKHQNGTVTYSHQLLGASLVHPSIKTVFPLMPEMIQRGDGARKNDCERNASKRFIEKFRQDHPKLKVIIVEDGLASNGPHIKHLQAHDKIS